MSRTAALSAPSAGAPLQATTIERRDLRHDDVRIDIEFAGICHSDIHQVREEWGRAQFPMVPGHEIAGIVSAVGDGVTRYKVGDRVGVGCMVDSCGECAPVQGRPRRSSAQEHTVGTYNDVRPTTASRTMGGYSQQVVVSSASPCASPTASTSTSPRRCCAPASPSTRPLKRWGAGPGTQGRRRRHGRTRAHGRQDRQRHGRRRDRPQPGHEQGGRRPPLRCGGLPRRPTDGSVFKDLRGQFDLIINTVSAELRRRRLPRAAAPASAPSSTSACRPRRSRSASAPSPPATRCWPAPRSAASREPRRCSTSAPSTASAPRSRRSRADEVNDAYDRVVDCDVRYRFVIDTSTIQAG